MQYLFRGKSYSSLRKLYREFEEITPVGYQSVRTRLKEGLGLEEALFNPKEKTGRKISPYEVEGVIYATLPDVARAYNLNHNAVYKRYARGKRGDDLVPPKKRKNYIEPPKKQKKQIKYKLTVQGKSFVSEMEACRYYDVRYITYRKRKYKGYSAEECLGLKEIFDKRTVQDKARNVGKQPPIKLEVGGKIYTSYTSLARAYDLPHYVVNQRIKKYGYTPEEAVSIKGKGKQLIVEGKKYNTMAEAARAYGKTSGQLLSQISLGRTMEQALGIEEYYGENSFEWNGKKYKSKKEFAEEYGMPERLLVTRLANGMSIEDALEQGDEKIINQGRYNKTILQRDSDLAQSRAHIYFISLMIDEIKHYKVGITTQSSPRARLTGLNYKIIKTAQSSLINCYELEQLILKKYKHRKATDIKADVVDGYTEIMDLSDKEVSSIIMLMNKKIEERF